MWGIMAAKRRSLPPLSEPRYEPRDVPRAVRDLTGSVMTRIRNRQCWLDSLAECLLVCNESARRFDGTVHARAPGTGGKPLSLEYLADRLDTDGTDIVHTALVLAYRGTNVACVRACVWYLISRSVGGWVPGADPLFGYTVRTDDAERRLQGFLTVTTFTTWQHWFKWDSITPQAHVLYDSDDEAPDDDDAEVTRLQWHKRRLVDGEGVLAAELNAQIHCGDPTGEGVIWPHLAEISLLGALGCGGTLVRTALRELEQGDNQYTHIVLQAAENSVAFYEKMGFVRVGAVAKYSSSSCAPGTQTPDTPPRDGHSSGSPPPPHEVVNPFRYYTVNAPEAEGETPHTIARDHGVETFDLLFLNRGARPDLSAQTLLRPGEQLRIPLPPPSTGGASLAAFNPWYRVQLRSETPKHIARKLSVSVRALVRLNRTRYPDLVSTSRLMAGTKLRVPRQEQEEIELDGAVPYRHWTFANDSVSSTPASCMMARRLSKKPKPSAAPAEAPHATTMRAELPRAACQDGTAAEMRVAEDGDDDQAAWTTDGVANASQQPSLLHKVVELLPKASGGATAAAAAAGRKKKQRKRAAPPESPEYYYVVTHVRDMHWCHGVRLHQKGTFSRGAHAGQPRWVVATAGGNAGAGAGARTGGSGPTGEAWLDASGDRCRTVPHMEVSRGGVLMKRAWCITDNAAAAETTAGKKRRRAADGGSSDRHSKTTKRGARGATLSSDGGSTEMVARRQDAHKELVTAAGGGSVGAAQLMAQQVDKPPKGPSAGRAKKPWRCECIGCPTHSNCDWLGCFCGV